jgi:D-arabinose 1-dehydrogenase-like Zn-dependent alcohol dehydrogenase
MKLVGFRKSIRGSFIGNCQQMKDMLEFCAEKNVRAMVSSVGEMSDCNTHLQAVRDGKAQFRIVLKN